MSIEKKKVVIVGGGFSGLFTALELAGSADVTLISEYDFFTFRPLLYEYLSGEVEAWQIAPKYKELIGNDLNFVRGTVEKIDFQERSVKVSAKDSAFNYDALILAVGGITNHWKIKGADEYTLPFRGIADADELRLRMTKALDGISPELDPQNVSEKLTFAVVGGGSSGVELATKMSDLLHDAIERRGLKGEPRLMIIEMTDQIVPEMGAETREYVEKTLKKAHIEIHTKTKVLEVSETGFNLEHQDEQTEVKTAAIIWTAGVKMTPLIESLDVPKDKSGLILIEQTLQIKDFPGVFALGDIAKLEKVEPQLAGTAQLANQEAVLAAENVRAFLAGEQLKTKTFEVLGEAVSLGTHDAAVIIGEKAFGGALARDARFALHTSRLPTWEHRLRVGASWFFGGTTPKPLQPLN